MTASSTIADHMIQAAFRYLEKGDANGLRAVIQEYPEIMQMRQMRIPANADSDSDRLRTAIPIDRGQRSGDRGQRLPSTASRVSIGAQI
jgi:hypothetical protein